jgi:hypothetical protein
MPLSVSHLCQTFFRCITCNFTAENGGKGVCESCAAVCHVGHTLSSALSGGFYCDCGSERKCVELARARAGGAGTSAAAPATSAATTQPRQWRNQAVTRKYCSRPGDEEGPLCTHGSDIIRTDHWSCCGVVPRQAACTLVRCSGGGVGVLKCKGCFCRCLGPCVGCSCVGLAGRGSHAVRAAVYLAERRAAWHWLNDVPCCLRVRAHGSSVPCGFRVSRAASTTSRARAAVLETFIARASSAATGCRAATASAAPTMARSVKTARRIRPHR